MTSPEGATQTSSGRVATTLTNLLYHVIFSTKNREPLVTAELKSGLDEYIGGIIRNKGGIALEIGGAADHRHIVARFRADASVSEMVGTIKANSSKWVNERQERRGAFAWQTGYGAFTVSYSQLQALREYVRDQEEHHRKISFKEEYLRFLKRHNIEFDETYLWD
jgi:REP element-mobilizing transposase RayT